MSSKPEREIGFYWVRELIPKYYPKDRWVVAQWDGKHWTIPGSKTKFADQSLRFAEFTNEKIIRDDQQ